MKKIIAGMFFFCTLYAQAQGDKPIRVVCGNWLAQSSGDNRVDIFWIDGSRQKGVRSIAVSREDFDSYEARPRISALVWGGDDGRYLAIGLRENRVVVWDFDDCRFVKVPSEALMDLWEKCLRKQTSRMVRQVKMGPKIQSLQARLLALSVR